MHTNWCRNLQYDIQESSQFKNIFQLVEYMKMSDYTQITLNPTAIKAGSPQ